MTVFKEPFRSKPLHSYGFDTFSLEAKTVPKTIYSKYDEFFFTTNERGSAKTAKKLQNIPNKFNTYIGVSCLHLLDLYNGPLN